MSLLGIFSGINLCIFFLLILSVEEPVLREFSFLGNENVLRFERKTNTSRFGKAHMVAPDLESEVDKENKRALGLETTAGGKRH